jgi:hypothetical protein
VSSLARLDSPLLRDVAKDNYSSLLGSVQYAAVCSLTYVSTTLSILGSAHAHSTEIHLQALKKVVGYLKGTIQFRVTLGRGGGDHSLQLTCFDNADWANDISTRQSRSGYVFTLDRGHISHKSKKKTYVVQSTCEAEYYSAADATKEGLHLRQLMWENFDAKSPELPPYGNTAKALSLTPITHWSTRRPNTSA